jgi:hypothetical protein
MINLSTHDMTSQSTYLSLSLFEHILQIHAWLYLARVLLLMVTNSVATNITSLQGLWLHKYTHYPALSDPTSDMLNSLLAFIDTIQLFGIRT